ncbi:hypothetical protein D3C71_1962610 [compost metagenome]
MTDHFLEGLIGHFHLIRRTRIDKPDHDTVDLGHDKTLWPGVDARGDFLASGRLVAFIRLGFNGETAIKVIRRDLAYDSRGGVHGVTRSARKEGANYK